MSVHMKLKSASLWDSDSGWLKTDSWTLEIQFASHEIQILVIWGSDPKFSTLKSRWLSGDLHTLEAQFHIPWDSNLDYWGLIFFVFETQFSAFRTRIQITWDSIFCIESQVQVIQRWYPGHSRLTLMQLSAHFPGLEPRFYLTWDSDCRSLEHQFPANQDSNARNQALQIQFRCGRGYESPARQISYNDVNARTNGDESDWYEVI